MSAPRGTNPYINHTSQRNEQSLVESLIIESIKIHGIMMYYIPRELVAEDSLFGEDPMSAFREYYPMEMYCDTPSGFEGDGDFVSKFGIEIRDISTFVCSKSRFQTETGRKRPKEGDLIYFPVSRTLFEIKFVEHEKPFFMLGKNYTFNMNVEVFRFSEETFETGEIEVDSLMESLEYKNLLTVSLTGMYSGTMFLPGDVVYQNPVVNAPTAATSSPAYSGIIQSITGSNGVTAQVLIKNVTGIWQKSSLSTNYYVTKLDNTKYYRVLEVSDSTDQRTDTNNKIIEDKADTGIVNFSEDNPFGDV